jgi:hypothetical protein
VIKTNILNLTIRYNGDPKKWDDGVVTLLEASLTARERKAFCLVSTKKITRD